jgi:hypothetical protein
MQCMVCACCAAPRSTQLDVACLTITVKNEAVNPVDECFLILHGRTVSYTRGQRQAQAESNNTHTCLLIGTELFWSGRSGVLPRFAAWCPSVHVQGKGLCAPLSCSWALTRHCHGLSTSAPLG